MECMEWTVLPVAALGLFLWLRAGSLGGGFGSVDVDSFWAGTFLGNVDFGGMIGSILEGCVEAACECGG